MAGLAHCLFSSLNQACAAVCVFMSMHVCACVSAGFVYICVNAWVRMCAHMCHDLVVCLWYICSRAVSEGCEPWWGFFFWVVVHCGLITQVFTLNHRKRLSVTTVCRQTSPEGKKDREGGKEREGDRGR